jgi:long-chain acyl-CoA synthetase
MNTQPWLKSYPPGARWDAPIEFCPVQSILETAAKRFGPLPALQFMDKRVSYAELEALANRAAVGFQKLGVGPGAHVGLYLPNTPHYPIAFFGVLKAGGTVVNISPLESLRGLEFKIEDSEIDILVTLDLASLYPQAERLLGSTRLKRLIVGEFAEWALAPDPVKAHMRAGGMLSEPKHGERLLAFRDLLDNDGAFQAHPLGDLTDALAVIQYTGGTTGEPKGAMLTHANLSAACAQYLETTHVGPNPLVEGEERTLCVLPLFHIYALSVLLILGLRLGAEIVVHPRFDPAAAAKDIALKKITVYVGVPTMHIALLNLPDAEAANFSSIKQCSSGGAPLPYAVQQDFEKLMGCRLAEGWGMSETSPTGTFTPNAGTARPGSCGIPLPGIELKFVDLADPTREVGLGERGEMCIKGPNVMKGYWKKPEATAAAMTPDGYLRTGDVAIMKEDGYVYIVDRIKDMLLVGGFNVYPRNIEEAIYQHPAVEEAGVIGVPDAYRGEKPKAFVKLKAGSPPLTLEELKAFLKDRLAKHEMIGELELCDDLPKTGAGKISKKDLREAEERRRAA